MTARQAHDSRRLWNELEGPTLFVLELNQVSIVLDNFVTLIFACVEELRESKPLACHLVPIIGVHELVIVNTVVSLSFYTFDGRLARVERDNVV